MFGFSRWSSGVLFWHTVPTYCSGVLFLAKYCSYGQMKEGEISRAYGTHGEKRTAYRLWMTNHEGENQFEIKVSMVAVY
jgi:hypothetical protein